MATSIALKRRIKSVANTKQITKAMELVAASKMRKAQEQAALGKEYRQAAYALLARLSQISDVSHHPLYVRRPLTTKLYLVITSNRGLAGAYNANIIRLLTKTLNQDRLAKINSQVIAVGKQAVNFVNRLKGVELLAAYQGISDHPSANEIRPMLQMIVEKYQTAQVDQVLLFYTAFKSNLIQEATSMSILPAELSVGSTASFEDKSTINNSVITFEPSVDAVLNNVSQRLLEIQLWQALLESIASEHSMRMMAMKNATDNASDLIDDLTLAFNTARQASITQELAEITGGAEAIAK